MSSTGAHFVRPTWHDLDLDVALAELVVEPEAGLSVLEVERRRREFGENALTERAGETRLQRFLAQFRQPLVYILLGAVFVTMGLREWMDAAVILAVVLVNAVIGYVQEAKALRAIDALGKAMDSEATVVREREARRLSARELVPGDVVRLQSGDRVPADLRLVRVRDLQVDESALTGESVPVEKGVHALPVDTPLADRANLAFSTTLVTYGKATGVVVATGDHTEIGRIHELIGSVQALETPLTRKIAAFSHLLLRAILVLAVAVAVAILLRGAPPAEVFLTSVALAVAAIPEGLPAVVTATLALGVARLAQRGAIIRRLPAVETLGSTTVVCSDKTGTLTQNQMTVREVLAGGRRWHATGSGYEPAGRLEGRGHEAVPEQDASLRELLVAGLLCNDSRLVQKDSEWRIEGDPTEGALLVAAAKAGLVRTDEEAERPRVDALPFESQHQYMATLHQRGERGVVYVKGSVEKLLPRCVDSLGEDALDAGAVETEVSRMAAEGLRVLAFARIEVDAARDHVDHGDVAGGLTFLGLQGMIDPPRPEAISAVAACLRAGIGVKMITGDHVGTATAIATQLGLEGRRDVAGQLEGLAGSTLEGLDDGELVRAAEEVSVFARVSPEQKLRLVEALQSRGHVVAMTGDGVNDAPALRQADIGVAMGITGTEVAKEAAEMVLTDDNFASIEAAVEEGRGIYDNLIKFVVWTLPTNLAEAGVILAAAFLGLELAITPLHILWINMTTAVLLGATLAFEAREPGLMERPPRAPDAPIVSRSHLRRIFVVGAILVVATYAVFEFKKALGLDLAAARTSAVNVIVVGELFFLFSCRSLRHSMFRLGVFSNRWLLGGVAAMLAAQLLFTYWSPMNAVFETAPTTWLSWVLAGVAGLAVYGWSESDKRRLRVGS